MGGFDPSKGAPGMRPRPSVSGDSSPLLGLSPLTPHSPVPGLMGTGGAGVAQGSFSPRSGDSLDDSLHSVSTDSSPGVHNNNLDRPLAKARRAPTKKKFETKVEDLPPVPVVPIAVTTSSAASGKSKGGLWKAIFGSKSNKSQTSAASGTNTHDDPREGSVAGSVSDSGLSLPHVLDDAVPDPSPVTPKTPGKISGLFSSLGMGKKVSKKQAVPQSAEPTPSNIGGKRFLSHLYFSLLLLVCSVKSL